MVSLKSSCSVEFGIKKIFFNFLFFELSRFDVLCEHMIFGMILFTLRRIFIQIKIFSVKIVIQNYISCHKMNPFCVPNRRKAIKKD